MPTLSPIPTEDGGIRFSREDAVKLGAYIIDLEAGYD